MLVRGRIARLDAAARLILHDPPRRLVIRWQHQRMPELKAEGASLCTMEIEPSDGAVKLTITHSIESDPSKFIEAVSGGWPKIVSNLKSLLEGSMKVNGRLSNVTVKKAETLLGTP